MVLVHIQQAKIVVLVILQKQLQVALSVLQYMLFSFHIEQLIFE